MFLLHLFISSFCYICYISSLSLNAIYSKYTHKYWGQPQATNFTYCYEKLQDAAWLSRA